MMHTTQVISGLPLIVSRFTIDLNKLPENGGHRFIIVTRDHIHHLLAGAVVNHDALARDFGVRHKEEVAGGAYFCMEGAQLLLLAKSGSYGCLPPSLHRSVAQLIRDQVESVGVQVTDVVFRLLAE